MSTIDESTAEAIGSAAKASESKTSKLIAKTFLLYIIRNTYLQSKLFPHNKHIGVII